MTEESQPTPPEGYATPPQGGSGVTPPSGATVPPDDGGPAAIHVAIANLMTEVQSIAKGGQAPKEAGGYRFRSLEDVLAKIGPAARRHGIAVQSRIVEKEYHTTTTDRHTWTWCRLTVLYKFTSLDDGSEFEFESAGEGRDNTDKATSKAMSMALKYGLSQAFLIDLGEPDPDGEKPMDTPEGDIPPQRAEAQRQGRQPQPAQDKAGRARQALAAAGNVDKRADLDAIAQHAQKEGLMDEQIGGTLLGDRLAAIRETLP